MAATHADRIPIQYWLMPPSPWRSHWSSARAATGLPARSLAVCLIGSVLVAVYHAELVAHWLGEPYGTLVLTLAVTIIELSLIVSLMLTDEPNPGLVRDTVFAVVMLVLNGLAGICIVAGTLRHREQDFQTLGANAFLAVLIPMVFLVLVLPNYTLTTPGPYYSTPQLLFVGSSCLALYLRLPVRADVRHQELLRVDDSRRARRSCRDLGSPGRDQPAGCWCCRWLPLSCWRSCWRRSSSMASRRPVPRSSSRA